MRASSETVLCEIRDLTARLAFESSLRRGYCRDWDDRHCEAARLHGVSPWLYTRLQRNCLAEVPETILQVWHEDYRSGAARSLRREERTRRILKAFNRCNIPVIVLKGTYLAHMVYEEPGLRQMHDLDIMVREEDREKSMKLLADHGYDVPLGTPKLPGQIGTASVPCARSDCAADCVDLHWCIQSMDYYRFSSSVVWENAIESRLLDCRAYVLSPELNFAHLLLHSLNHTYLLRSWLDLALLWSRTGVEITRLLTLASALGVQRPLYWGFWELSRNWRLDIPASVREALASHVPKIFEDLIIRHPYRRYWRVLARIRFLPGWRCRLAYVHYLIARRL